MTIGELQNKYNYVPWLDYAKKHITNVTITKEEVVMVMSPTYFKNLENVLRLTPKRVLANYMMWHTVSSVVSFLPKHIRDLEVRAMQKIIGTHGKPSRWNECTQKVAML